MPPRDCQTSAVQFPTMATSLAQSTGEYATPRGPQDWNERYTVVSALLFIAFVVLVGWFTYASAKAENETRANHPAMDAR